jgi:hypothetical protein
MKPLHIILSDVYGPFKTQLLIELFTYCGPHQIKEPSSNGIQTFQRNSLKYQ